MGLLNEIDTERFLSKINKFKEGCWIWTDAVSRVGYGYLGIGGRKGRKIQAHRISYEHFIGPIPKGFQIDHLCRNRRCVNPAHLEIVTQRENLLRGIGISAINAKKTCCIRGHPFTTIVKNGARECRTCKNDRAKQIYKRLRDSGVEYSLAYKMRHWDESRIDKYLSARGGKNRFA